MKLSRLHIFKDTGLDEEITAKSSEVNAEIDQMHALLNGELSTENFKPDTKVPFTKLSLDSNFLLFYGMVDKQSDLPGTLDFGGARINRILAYVAEDKQFFLGTSDGSAMIELSGVFRWEPCDVTSDPDLTYVTGKLTEYDVKLEPIELEMVGSETLYVPESKIAGLSASLSDLEGRNGALSTTVSLVQSKENEQNSSLLELNGELSTIEEYELSVIAKKNRKTDGLSVWNGVPFSASGKGLNAALPGETPNVDIKTLGNTGSENDAEALNHKRLFRPVVSSGTSTDYFQLQADGYYKITFRFSCNSNVSKQGVWGVIKAGSKMTTSYAYQTDEASKLTALAPYFPCITIMTGFFTAGTTFTVHMGTVSGSATAYSIQLHVEPLGK